MQVQLGPTSLFFDHSEVANTLPILFIHAALGTSQDLDPMRARFTDRTTYTIDLPSHGQSSSLSGVTNSEQFGELLLEFLDSQEIEKVDIIGYSLGGYAALELASKHPERVRSIVSHAMKFYWTPEAIEKSVQGLSAEFLRANAARYYSSLEKMHTAVGAEEATRKVAELIADFTRRRLTLEEIKSSNTPLLLTVGDTDDLIPLNELLDLFQGIGTEQAAIAVYPSTRHAIKTVSLDLFEHTVRHFWSKL